MALLERLAMKDRQALSELHSLWAPSFLGIAYRILGDRKHADLATRRAFIRIWRNAASYNPHTAPPLVWAANHLRVECIRILPKTKPQEKPPRTTGVLPTGQTRVISADDRQRLQSAINHLSPEQLSALEQAVFLGFAKNRPGAPHPDSLLKTTLRTALDTLRANLSLHEL